MLVICSGKSRPRVTFAHARVVERNIGRSFPGVPVLMICSMCAAGVPVPAQTLVKNLPDAPLSNRISLAAEARNFRPGVAQIPMRTLPVPVRLSAKQKYALAFRTIVSPQTVLRTAFDSGFQLAAGTGPDVPTNGWGPFAQRFGYNQLNISTAIFLSTGIVPAMVHQDPRYPVLGRGSVKTRVAWALKHEFVGFSDSGREMPNYGNLAGLGLASITANAYLPRGNVGYGDTVESYCIKIAVKAGMNVAREFRVFDHAKTLVRPTRAAD